jgi:hypothetical protein
MNDTGSLFSFDKGAVDYIKKRSESLVISFKMEPALGGCACSNKHITGSYQPTISVGSPAEKERYLVETVKGIDIYFPKNLRPKYETACITIKLRKTLFMSWLELEGAKAIAEFN